MSIIVLDFILKEELIMAESNFTWLPFFEELAIKICENSNPEHLYNIWHRFFPGQYEYIDNDGKIPLNKIDPLSFLGKLISFGDTELTNKCAELKKIFSMRSAVPKDYDGLPRPYRPNCVFLDEYWSGRKDKNDLEYLDVIIETLWEFAKDLSNKSASSADSKIKNIDTVLQYARVGMNKLSQILFLVKPHLYYSCDENSLLYLGVGITDPKDYAEYAEIQSISRQYNKSPYVLSHLAELCKQKRQKFHNYIKNIEAKVPSYSLFIKNHIFNNVFEYTIHKLTKKCIFDIKTNNELNNFISLLRKYEEWFEYNKVNGNGIPHAILNTHYRNFINNIKNEGVRMHYSSEESGSLSLNQILYGPPGTGKTYEIKKIIEDNIYPQIDLQNNSYETFYEEEAIANADWWIKIALAFKLDNPENKPLNNKEISELPILNKWFLISNKYKNLHSYERSLSAELQKRSKRKEGEYSLNKNNCDYFYEEDKKYQLSEAGCNKLKQFLSENDLDLEDIKKEEQNLYDKKKLAREYYEFVTFHQSYSYEEFIEGIRPVLSKENSEKENKEQQSLLYEYHDGIFKNICTKARKKPNKKFFIFIDEINRGNISKIFGELITLIEKDKRENVNNDKSIEYNTIEVKLPYTNELFTIPNNLYIIGTMNTADRSIALLDTALRRRFDFIEIPPKPELFKDIKIADINLQDFLANINKRIEKEYDKDHMIGHAYLIGIKDKEDLKKAFERKLLPLLNEYFYNDTKTVAKILKCSISKLEGKNWIEIMREAAKVDNATD